MSLPLALILAGTVGGFLVGLLGVGGGLIYVAVLHSVFEGRGIDGFESTRYVLANAMLVQACAGVAAALRFGRAHPLPWRAAAWVAAPAAVTSAALSVAVQSADWYRRDGFLGLFIIFLAFSAVRIFWASRPGAPAAEIEVAWQARPVFVFLQTGVLAGVVAGLAGLAGGVFIIPWLNQRHGLPLRQAIATAIIAVIPGALANVVVYMLGAPSVTLSMLQVGYVVGPVAGPMVLGVVFSTSIGVRLAGRLPVARLKLLFGGLLLVMIVKLVWFDLLPRG